MALGHIPFFNSPQPTSHFGENRFCSFSHIKRYTKFHLTVFFLFIFELYIILQCINQFTITHNLVLYNSKQFDLSKTILIVHIKCLFRALLCYLSSNCSILLFWRRRFKNALLLLRWECRVQWNDFNVTNFRAQIINLTFYSLAGFINFLQNKV